MLPKGIRIEGFCTPKRHFEVVLRIPIRSPKERPTNAQVSPLTSLGKNPTQHLDEGSAGDNGKSALVGGDSQAGPTSSLQRGLPDSVDPPFPDESANLKGEGTEAPQHVAVDGCGDITLLNDAGAKLASPGEARALWGGIPRKSAPSDSPGTKGREKLPQPVAVGGCGGPPPPFANDHGIYLLVTAWTEKPVIPSNEPPPQAKEALPHHAGVVDTVTSLTQQRAEDLSGEDNTDGITVAIPAAIEPNLRQNGACLLNTKEQLADGKPWASALSTSEILAPIPEVDVSVVSGEAVESSGGTAKPKALPLTVSQAARQGLAKIATPKTLPKQTRSQLGGYVHGLTVAAGFTQSMPLGQKITSTSEELLTTLTFLNKFFQKKNLLWTTSARWLNTDQAKEPYGAPRVLGSHP